MATCARKYIVTWSNPYSFLKKTNPSSCWSGRCGARNDWRVGATMHQRVLQRLDLAGRKGIGECCSCRLRECRLTLPVSPAVARAKSRAAPPPPSAPLIALRGKRRGGPKAARFSAAGCARDFHRRGASVALAGTNQPAPVDGHQRDGTGRADVGVAERNQCARESRPGRPGFGWLVTARPCRRWAASDSGHRRACATGHAC